MKKIVVIFIAVIFMMIGGCQKKTNVEKKVSQTNDIITDLIKEDLLSNSTNTNNATNTNINLTEKIPSTNLAAKISVPKQEVSKKIPVEPEVGVVNGKKVIEKEEKKIKDEGIKIPSKIKPKTKNTAVAKKETIQGGSYIKIGNDSSSQSVSPRKMIRITTAVFTDNKNAQYVDFIIYAVPKGKELNLNEDNLISMVKSIEVINGQAQLTKSWNGRNLDDGFMEPGNYNIYLVYMIKDENMNTIKKESRFWGGDNKFYIRLY